MSHSEAEKPTPIPDPSIWESGASLSLPSRIALALERGMEGWIHPPKLRTREDNLRRGMVQGLALTVASLAVAAAVFYPQVHDGLREYGYIADTEPIYAQPYNPNRTVRLGNLGVMNLDNPYDIASSGIFAVANLTPGVTLEVDLAVMEEIVEDPVIGISTGAFNGRKTVLFTPILVDGADIAKANKFSDSEIERWKKILPELRTPEGRLSNIIPISIRHELSKLVLETNNGKRPNGPMEALLSRELSRGWATDMVYMTSLRDVNHDPTNLSSLRIDQMLHDKGLPIKVTQIKNEVYKRWNLKAFWDQIQKRPYESNPPSTCEMVITGKSSDMAPATIDYAVSTSIMHQKPTADKYVVAAQYDFDGDGIWDTDFASSEYGGVRAHTYTTAGNYRLLGRVQLSDGEITEPCGASFSLEPSKNQ